MKKLMLLIAMIFFVTTISSANADYAPIGNCNSKTHSCFDEFTIQASSSGTNWWSPISFSKHDLIAVGLFTQYGRPLKKLNGKHPCFIDNGYGCKYRSGNISAKVRLYHGVIDITAYSTVENKLVVVIYQ